MNANIKQEVINTFKESGFSYLRSIDQVIHHFTKDGLNYGLIFLKKTKPGYLRNSKTFNHFIDLRHFEKFPPDYAGRIFVVIYEKSSNQLLIQNIQELSGNERVQDGEPVLNVPRVQFLPWESVVSSTNGVTTLGLNQLLGSTNSTQQ